eukprot:TRINITY_DN57794_c0_g1_i1.p2 TRINITY_DN57794_c0_g1~~TRINITY_DN57794_c0_g1_i1.p2  ORF type:complete len:121 (+),score=9.95 TRINITY_DN57794_c0_g1_i1:42-365(+)
MAPLRGWRCCFSGGLMAKHLSENDHPSKGPWPGEPDARERLARMIRVDHAGEYGAKRIYEGQMAVLGKGPKGPVLRHMADQEAEHLAYFEKTIKQEQKQKRKGSHLK